MIGLIAGMDVNFDALFSSPGPKEEVDPTAEARSKFGGGGRTRSQAEQHLVVIYSRKMRLMRFWRC
jgi:hypothetical protein